MDLIWNLVLLAGIVLCCREIARLHNICGLLDTKCDILYSMCTALHLARKVDELQNSRYRVETKNGVHFVAGDILPADMVQAGQTWVSSSGHMVNVKSVQYDQVTYTWPEDDEIRQHEKDNFSFQCRYSLVLETPELPEKLR